MSIKSHIYKAMAAVALLPAMGIISSCNDDDENVYVFEDPAISPEATTVSFYNLSFQWKAVAGVNQYGYELTDPAGKLVATGVTDITKVSFADLEPGTEYTLTVSAYGPNGQSSHVCTLKQKTSDLILLKTPVLTAMQQGPAIEVTWENDPEAEYYVCVYIDGMGEAVTEYLEAAPLTIYGLVPDQPYTISVCACSEAEGRVDSDFAQVEATRVRAEAWTVEGKYTSALILRPRNTWNTSLTGYDDGSYVLHKWYNVEGYDLEFYVDTDGTIVPVNFPLSSGYFLIPTGNTSVPEVYMWPYYDTSEDLAVAYSGFEGDAASGNLWWYTYSGSRSGNDTFVW